MATKSGKFKFRKHANVGYPAAEEDSHYLDTCFIDIGDLEVLENCDRAERVIVGRTGAGKSTLIKRLRDTQDHVIEFSPYNLAVEHICNSDILRFFIEAGVNLELFYKLLWRHVFTVELIREHHDLHNLAAEQTWVEYVTKIIRGDTKKKRQIEYLRSHGGSFWKQTEERVKDATKRTESQLTAAVSGVIPAGLTLDLGGARTLTKEERTEVVQRGQEVISEIKIRDLNEMFDLLKDELITDRQKKYYIVIDGLDEAWVDDTLQYQLIRALIETIREFQKVKHVKIIACLRTDLIERVYRHTRGERFQEEKIKSLYLELKWTQGELLKLLDERVSQLARDAYTTASIGLLDILPPSRGDFSASDYLISRTQQRPRDAIMFLNACIQQATDSPRIAKSMILAAEGEYSRDRLSALGDEWQSDYPTLLDFAGAIKKHSKHFDVSDIGGGKLEDFCVEILVKHERNDDSMLQFANRFFNNIIDTAAFQQFLASIFYKVGLCGLKLESYSEFDFNISGSRSVSYSDISPSTRCAVHPMFWRALGISP